MTTTAKPPRITARTRLTFDEPTHTEVRALRLSTSLQQHDVAALLCVTAQTYARWEADPADSGNARGMPAGMWLLMRVQIERVKAGLPAHA